MLTLFSTAKAFKGHNGVIQRNALQSWKRLHPKVEIILFGDDEGSAEVCAELGLRHEAHVERTPFGASRVDTMFDRAQMLAGHDLLCYVNCDIILMSDFWSMVERFQRRPKPFLAIGKRWDTDIREPLQFGPAWEMELRARARAQNKQRAWEIDYFLFSKGVFGEIPPFGLGRLYWDHWLAWKARSTGPLIDVSPDVMVVHQSHDYNHHPQGWKGVWEGDDAKRNGLLAASGKQACSFWDCTHVLTPSGREARLLLRRPAYDVRCLLEKIYAKLFDVFMVKTLPARKALGLRRESFRKLRP
jgi:hypothetical protein